MLKAGGRAAGSSDQAVFQQAAQRKKGTAEANRKAGANLLTVVAVVGAIAALAWWRRRGQDSNSKRPAGKSPAQSSSRQPSKPENNLPRNKTSNNKKNKDRKKAEKERRAEKREKQEPRAGPSDNPEDKDNTIILTSTFVDSTPRSTTGAARPQRQEKSTGDAKSKESSLDPAMRDMLRKRGS